MSGAEGERQGPAVGSIDVATAGLLREPIVLIARVQDDTSGCLELEYDGVRQTILS